MSKSPTAVDLLRECADALSSGANFPAVWNGILNGHPLVVGAPIQAALDRLEVPLIHHQRLVFDSTNKKFALS